MGMLKELFSKPIIGPGNVIGDVPLDEDDSTEKGPVEGNEVADWHKGMFNTIHEAGRDISPEMLEIADHDLEHSGKNLNYDGNSWSYDEEDGEKSPVQYAKIHSPMGGISVAGRFFRGGTWIPSAQVEKLSERDKAALKAKVSQADPNKTFAATGKHHAKMGQDNPHRLQKGNLQRLYEARRSRWLNDLNRVLAHEGNELQEHHGAVTNPEHKEKLAGKMADIHEMMKLSGVPSSPEEGGQEAIAGPEDAGKTTEGEKRPAPYIKKIKDEGDKEVWLVDATWVRNNHDSDFAQGGNGYEADWIPKNEIWIDSALPQDEIEHAIQHEAEEAKLMEGGMSYEEAHKIAKGNEDKARSKKTGITKPDGKPDQYQKKTKKRSLVKGRIIRDKKTNLIKVIAVPK